MSIDQVLKSEGTPILNFYLCNKSSVQTENDVFYYLSNKSFVQTEKDIFHYRALHRCQIFFKKLGANIRKQAKNELLENNFDHLVKVKEEDNNHLRFEISTEKMNELLEHRLICAADVRCLDTNSKQCLKALCLNTCLYKPPQPKKSINKDDLEVEIEKCD